MDGEKLIALARRSIEDKFGGKETQVPREEWMKEKRGVFVTLTKYGELRGCIGFPYPLQGLGEGVVKAARNAAFSDPRFPQLSEKEFPEIRIEISVLSVPEKIKADSENIEIGKDGLMCEYQGFGGLLLPQVAVEYKWGAEEFLRQLCNKAGLPLDSWKKSEFKLWKFQADIVKEKEVEGES